MKRFLINSLTLACVLLSVKSTELEVFEPTESVTYMPLVNDLERCSTSLTPGLDYGSCGSVVRYFYNSKLNRCIPFVGCINMNSDSNNFPTLGSCQKCVTLASITAIRSGSDAAGDLSDNLATTTLATARSANVCLMKLKRLVDFDSCILPTTRYYFSRVVGRCLGFKGCINIGTNNFDSLAECEQVCHIKRLSAATTTQRTTAQPLDNNVDQSTPIDRIVDESQANSNNLQPVRHNDRNMLIKRTTTSPPPDNSETATPCDCSAFILSGAQNTQPVNSLVTLIFSVVALVAIQNLTPFNPTYRL